MKITRIIFLWIPLSIIALVIVALIGIKLYLSPGRVEKLAVKYFGDLTTGSISLNVKKFSPYSGFDIRDIVIRNGAEFGNTKLVEIKRLVLKYGFFSIFTGDVHLDEIGIYGPRIYLDEKDGAWNVAKLMKPGEPKAEEPAPEPEPEPETGEPSTEIRLPIKVKVLLNFVLDDLRVFVNGSDFKASVKGLAYNLSIRIPKFKIIPKSIDAVRLIRTMTMELNPKGFIDVSFSSKDAGVKTPLVLNWRLNFEKKDGNGNPVFNSGFKFGVQKTPVRFRKTIFAPLDFLISYDLFYNADKDHLKINSFNVSFNNSKWIAIAGDVRDVMQEQKFSIRMTESRIDLSSLYPYFVSLTGDRSTRFGGEISLFPLNINGNLTNIDLNGGIKIRNIQFKTPGIEASFPLLTFLYDIMKKNDDIDIGLDLDLGRAAAKLGRDKLGDNGMALNADISTFNNFSRVKINKFTFDVFNSDTKLKSLQIGMNGNVKLSPELSGNIEISQITFIKDNLSDGIKNKLLAAVPLTKPLDVKLNLDFSLGAEITKAGLVMIIRVPDYNVNDLKISADVLQDVKKQKINLNYLKVGAESLGLSIKADGYADISVSPIADADLNLALEISIPEMKKLYDEWELSGKVEIKAGFNGDLKTGKASGILSAKDLFVRNLPLMLAVDEVDLAFPFEYSFASGPVVTRIAVDKSGIIENENLKESENFTIKSIKAKHPARNLQFEYVKDFAAVMFFKNSAFELAKLKMYVLDGAVYGRDILFYLADMPATGSFKNVEYKLTLDVTNVDIGQLDNPDPAAKTREAELSLNADFSGKGLDMFVGSGKDKGKELNVKGYININKVGDKFARKLLQGLSEKEGKSILGILQIPVDNSMNIKGFNYNLNLGLMDVDVAFIRKAFGLIVVVEDVRITRVPIQEYLNNIFGSNKNAVQ